MTARLPRYVSADQASDTHADLVLLSMQSVSCLLFEYFIDGDAAAFNLVIATTSDYNSDDAVLRRISRESKNLFYSTSSFLWFYLVIFCGGDRSTSWKLDTHLR